MSCRAYEIAADIFDTRKYTVEVSQMEIEAIRETKVNFITSTPTGSHIYGGCQVTHSSDMETHIINRLLGRPIRSDSEWVNKIQERSKSPELLTLNEVVELWDNFRSITFSSLKDIVTAYNTIKDYLYAIDEARFHVFNYLEPPEGDIIKINNLADAICTQAEMLVSKGVSDDSRWGDLLKLFGAINLNGGVLPVKNNASKNTEKPSMSPDTVNPFKDFM